MKNFLAVDTSCEYMSIVAAKDGKIFTSFTPDCAMRHSVLIMQKVDEVLDKANLKVEECDFFSAVVGAGSFTGIRIGISAVKGFCLAFGKTALPVTSFDVAAYNAVGGEKGKILCLVDALHDSYYACGYEGGKIVYPPVYIGEEEVLRLCEEEGFSLRSCLELPLSRKTKVTLVDPTEGLKNAVLARSKENAFGELDALYIRKSSAELNLCR